MNQLQTDPENQTATTSDNTRQIYAEQVKLLYIQSPLALFATVINATLVTFVQWPIISHGVLIAWLLFMMVTAALRYALIHQYRISSPTPDEAIRWGRWHVIAATVAGLGWGGSAIFLYPQTSIMHQAFLAFVLGGMTAGAVATFSPKMESCLAFIIPNLVPIIVRFSIEKDRVHLTMGAMVSLFMVLMLMIAKRFHIMTLTSLKLRFENSNLIAHLATAKEQAEALNEKLSQEIIEHQTAQEALKLHQDHLEEVVEERTSELQRGKERLEQTLAELRQTQLRVIQHERLQALGQMASGIAHDFNNTLAPILGFSDLLLNSSEALDENLRDNYLKMIHVAAVDAANVIKRLSEFYRQHQDNTFQPVNLNGVVEHVIQLTRPKWKDEAMASGITVDVQTDLQQVPFVIGNETDLREVLTNLIFNAVEALASDGVITLCSYLEDDLVILKVSDTGKGMTPEVQRHCFDPFFTSKLERGTGLGLSIVFGIIQRHKGQITVESELNVGTTFTIRLPASAEQPIATHNQPAEAISRSLRVLIVDDEPSIRQMITAYLINDGHTVETATDGSEGLLKFEEGPFDLVITDRAMPEMNGEQLAVSIKQLSPNTPVIMLTGFGDIMQASGERSMGVDEILSKPVTLNAFQAALAKVF